MTLENAKILKQNAISPPERGEKDKPFFIKIKTSVHEKTLLRT